MISIVNVHISLFLTTAATIMQLWQLR